MKFFANPSGKYLECLILETAPSPQHKTAAERKDRTVKRSHADQESSLPSTSAFGHVVRKETRLHF